MTGTEASSKTRFSVKEIVTSFGVNTALFFIGRILDFLKSSLKVKLEHVALFNISNHSCSISLNRRCFCVVNFFFFGCLAFYGLIWCLSVTLWWRIIKCQICSNIANDSFFFVDMIHPLKYYSNEYPVSILKKPPTAQVIIFYSLYTFVNYLAKVFKAFYNRAMKGNSSAKVHIVQLTTCNSFLLNWVKILTGADLLKSG